MSDDEIYEVLEAVIVRPGDTLIIRCSPNISARQAHDLREHILARMPGLGDVAIVAADQIGVYRPEPEPTEVIPLKPKVRP